MLSESRQNSVCKPECTCTYVRTSTHTHTYTHTYIHAYPQCFTTFTTTVFNDSSCTDYLLLSDLLLLLFEKLCGYASDAVLGAGEQLPQFLHEDPRVLPVEKSRQVQLHVLRVWELRGKEGGRGREGGREGGRGEGGGREREGGREGGREKGRQVDGGGTQ